MVILIAGLCLQVGWYGLIINQTLRQQSYLRRVDFSIFYTAGRIARAGGWNAIYDLQRQLETQSSLVGEQLALNQLLPFNHPPLLVPLQALIAVENYLQAYLMWLGIQFLMLLASGFCIFRMVRRLGWYRPAAWFFTIEGVLFYPMVIGLIKGQDTSLALLGMVVGLSGLVQNHDQEAGLGLSLLVIRPQLALPIALPFFFKRRRIWWWFLGGASLLGLISVLLVGRQGVQDFLRLLAISANGETVVIHQFDMYNLKGMLIRQFPLLDVNIIYALSWAAYWTAIILLCLWWTRSQEIGPRQLGVATILALFVSPHLHYHDLGLLLIPVIALCFELVRHRLLSPWGSAVVILGITLYLAVIQLTPFNFSGVYLLMLSLGSALWYVEKRPIPLQPSKEAE